MVYGSGEIDQQLRAHISLIEDPILFPASTSGNLQLPGTSVSGDFTPSSGHRGHGHTHAHVHTHNYTY